MQGETVLVIPASEKGKIICGTEFAQVPGSTYQEMQDDGEAHCIPYGIWFWVRVDKLNGMMLIVA